MKDYLMWPAIIILVGTMCGCQSQMPTEVDVQSAEPQMVESTKGAEERQAFLGRQKPYTIPENLQKLTYTSADFEEIYMEYAKMNGLEEKSSEPEGLEAEEKENLNKKAIAYVNEFVDITPKEVTESVKCQIFKGSQTCETFVLYNHQVICIGLGGGGYGVMSILPCDFDNNGVSDLVYTFSWGSGIHRSQIGVLNLKEQKEMALEYGLSNKDLILQALSPSEVDVYTAEVSMQDINFAQLTFTPKEQVAKITAEKGMPVIKVLKE